MFAVILDTRFSRPGRGVSVALALFVATVLLACKPLQKSPLAGSPPQESPAVVELVAERDYLGQIDQVAFDQAGNQWMASRESLYRIQGGKAQRVDLAMRRYDQLALAPRGDLYARLLAGKVSGGLFTVELVELTTKASTGTPLAELKLRDPPYGFGALYLGGADRLIATATPLDNPEGLGGRFLYAFWSAQGGEPIKRITLEGLREGVVGIGGDTLLLLGEKDAIAFDKEGRKLWEMEGSFRHAALAAGATTALLNPNPDEAIDKVVVVHGASRATIDLHSPVYDVALTADGSVGAVATDNGQLSVIALASCKPTSCETRPVSVLPNDGTYVITSILFINATTLAVGVIRRIRAGARFTYPSGAALAVTTSGEVLLQKEVALEQPATWAPSIDAAYGGATFAARTPHRVLFLTPGH